MRWSRKREQDEEKENQKKMRRQARRKQQEECLTRRHTGRTERWSPSITHSWSLACGKVKTAAMTHTRSHILPCGHLLFPSPPHLYLASHTTAPLTFSYGRHCLDFAPLSFSSLYSRMIWLSTATFFSSATQRNI